MWQRQRAVSETGKLINGRAIAVVVAGVVRDSEESERDRKILSVGKR
jgi:hypothetical protein